MAGVYQGVSTQEATQEQGLWDLFQGQKRHRKKTEEQLGKRALFSAGSNILETFLPPGYKQAVDVMSKQAEQKLFKLDKYEGERGFWTASESKEYEEEEKAIREGADTSLLEGVIGGVKSYLGGKAGEKFLGGAQDWVSDKIGGAKDWAGGKLGEFTSETFADSPKFAGDWGARTLGIGGKQFGEEVTAQGIADNPFLAPDYVEDWREGGRVPKYQKGGITPEDIKAMVRQKTGSTDFDEQEQIFSNIRKFGDPGAFGISPSEVENLYQSNPEAQKNFAADMARLEERKSSESGLSGIFSKFLGRNKSKYAVGGMVQGGAPSIIDYFSAQGKTLGGSDTESLSTQLGRR